MLPALGQLFNVTGGLHGPFISHDNLYFKSEVQGADGYGVFNLTKSGRLRVDALFGFRWLNLGEQEDFSTTNRPSTPLRSTSSSTRLIRSRRATTSTAAWSGCGLYVPDDGSGGRRGELCYRGAFLFALGDTVERININGESQTNLGNPPAASNINYAGGVFAQPTNMGAHDADHFAFVPEGDFAVGYAFASWGRVMLGYDVIYISDVARPGDQIDPGVNVYRSGVVQAPRLRSRPRNRSEPSGLHGRPIDFLGPGPDDRRRTAFLNGKTLQKSAAKKKTKNRSWTAACLPYNSGISGAPKTD